MSQSTENFSYRSLATLLIIVAGGMALGRILNTELVLEPSQHKPYGPRGWKYSDEPPLPMPTFSSNDRSRWATVRSLVDEGTYVIGQRTPADNSKGYIDSGIVFDDGYGTVDKALKPDTQEFYSTKPPLLPTMMAGEYWVLKNIFGLSIVEDRWTVIRVIVLTFNWLPFLIYLILLSKLIGILSQNDRSRLFVLASACFATLLTPFLISINNHTVAACSVMVSLYASARIWLAPRDADNNPTCSWIWFALAGFFAAFTACNELPAAAFAVGLLTLGLWSFPRRTLLVFLPALLIPIVALFVTNYLAIGELEPVYAKRYTEWYLYEGSHWQVKPGEMKSGIDWAGQYETKGVYAFHLLLGHHGLFSLTPIFVLAFIGMILAFKKRTSAEHSSGSDAHLWHIWSRFALLTLLLSLVVIGFYILRSDNYGGWSCGPRWLMWLTPFWLLTMVPILDRLLQRRWGRVIACILLLLSVMSASYPAWNPWRQPWIYNWMDSQGWIPY